MRDYVVIRRAPDLPADFNIGDFDGKWLDRAQLNIEAAILRGSLDRLYDGEPHAVAVPSGRFEVRDDGAVAEVWEIRP